MQRDARKFESALKKKGFREDERDHSYFIYHTLSGKKTLVKTKTSHTPKMKTLGDSLLGQITKQLHLTKTELLDLIDCTMNQEKYESILRAKKQA